MRTEKEIKKQIELFEEGVIEDLGNWAGQKTIEQLRNDAMWIQALRWVIESDK